MATISLMSSDDALVTVERAVAERSILIKNMLEDLGDSGEAIPIPNVRLAIHFPTSFHTQAHCSAGQRNCSKESHRVVRPPQERPPTAGDDDDNRRKTTDIDEWDQKFMQVDQEMLFEVILAANYLDIKALLDVGCKTVANMIKGKSPEEIRKTFNIQNDFTPEEEDQIRRENEWAEDR
ncbi:hypothetical protein N7513_007452 [Penicillium frequentans]|nr:hypothetical protein N7513_007452 [Penicillium glabrum]